MAVPLIERGLPEPATKGPSVISDLLSLCWPRRYCLELRPPLGVRFGGRLEA